MRKQERVKIIQALLDHYFSCPSIPLTHHSSYTLLIAVLLSARCTDKRVNLITAQLFALASTPQEMACLPLDTIESIIRPCGLAPAKSKAIQKLSKILIEKYRGEVPQTFEELESFPGVGHKTASVVMVQAFGHPAFPVDTHIHRCAKRWGLSQGKNVTKTEEDLKKLFPKEKWGCVHLQIIHYARKYCPARGHQVKDCLICTELMLR